jgi:octopine/nopaline transport system substrate-binding protein
VRKILFALAGAAALASMTLSADAQQRQVRIATEGAYRPWNFTDAGGQLIGFELDLARDLCRRMNAECTIVAQDWDGIIPALQQRRYDAIMAGMSITDRRLETIDFAGPYASDATVFSALKSSPFAQIAAGQPLDMAEVSAEEKATIDGLAQQLRGRAVGVQVSTIQQQFLEQLMPGVTVRTYDATDNIFLDLASGRIDAALVDRAATNAFLGSEQGRNVQVFGPAFTRGVLGRGVGVGLRKGEGELKQAFEQAIAAARADGTITRLSNQWFGYDIAIKD